MLLLSSRVVCTLHVLCADDVLMLTFTEGVLGCTPGWRGAGHQCNRPRLDLRPSLLLGTRDSAPGLQSAPCNCFVLQCNSKGGWGKQQIQLVSAKPSFQLHPQSSLIKLESFQGSFSDYLMSF